MIRVVAYNVSGGIDASAAGRVLSDLGAQVACVLESPGGSRLRTLCRRAGLEVAHRSGRRSAGTAILTAPDVHVRATTTVPLTAHQDVPRREASHAILGHAGLRLSVTAVQLGLRPDVRRTNLEELRSFLGSMDLPLVIGCDLNESARSPVASSMAQWLQDAFAVAGTGSGHTYPTSDPSTRQDFVFVDRRLEVVTSRVGTGAGADVASHHRPVLAEVRRTSEQTSGGDASSDGDQASRDASR